MRESIKCTKCNCIRYTTNNNQWPIIGDLCLRCKLDETKNENEKCSTQS